MLFLITGKCVVKCCFDGVTVWGSPELKMFSSSPFSHNWNNLNNIQLLQWAVQDSSNMIFFVETFNYYKKKCLTVRKSMLKCYMTPSQIGHTIRFLLKRHFLSLQKHTHTHTCINKIYIDIYTLYINTHMYTDMCMYIYILHVCTYSQRWLWV